MTRSAYGRHGRGHPGPWHGRLEHRADRLRRRAEWQVARHDHRRERRLQRRGGPSHPVAKVAVVSGAVLLAGTAVAVVVTVIAQILAVLLFAMLAVGAYSLVKGSLGNGPRGKDTAHRPEVDAPTSARTTAETAEEAWRRARADFQRVRAEFVAHETDPMAVLHRPALSDVSVGSTARFVDAFSAAQALDTDGYPAEPYGASYVRAVDQARRAWRAAVEAADRIRLSGLAPEERRTVERVVKLLTTARDSDSEPERLAAYARARSELDRLDRAGVVHLPKAARAQLDARARGELPGS